MRPIPSCPNYFASEDGHIFRDGKQLKERPNGPPHGRGYMKLAISVSGKLIDRYVHRLVCEAYHGPCPPKMQCRHLDGSKTNNRPENLCWGTVADNIADRQVHSPNDGDNSSSAILTSAIVAELRHRVEDGGSQTELAKEFGLKVATVHAAIRGSSWKYLPNAVRGPRPPDQAGAKNGNAKLREHEVATIRDLIARGWSNVAIAAMFNVHHGTISKIRRRKSWRHAIEKEAKRA